MYLRRIYDIMLSTVTGVLSWLIVTIPSMVAMMVLTIIACFLYEDGLMFWFVAMLLLIFLLVECFAFGFARFWLRCWAVNANGRRRTGVIIASLVLLAIASLVLLACALYVYASLLIGRHLGLLDRFRAWMGAVYAVYASIVVVAMVVVLRAHINPTYYAASPFSLYLRRFSTFSDRTVLAQILRVSPRGLPVLFIASPGNRPRNWDSIMWTFAGLRLWRPIRSLPIQVRSSDAEWQRHIEEMMRHSRIVVMDLSDFSESLRVEVQMLAQHVSSGRIIWLRRANDKKSLDWGGLGLQTPPQVIEYQCSYFAAIPGLILKLVLISVNMIVILSILGVDQENPKGRLWTEVLKELTVAVGVLVVLYVVFYFRPAVTKKSVRAIRKRIRDSLRVPIPNV